MGTLCLMLKTVKLLVAVISNTHIYTCIYTILSPPHAQIKTMSEEQKHVDWSFSETTRQDKQMVQQGLIPGDPPLPSPSCPQTCLSVFVCMCVGSRPCIPLIGREKSASFRPSQLQAQVSKNTNDLRSERKGERMDALTTHTLGLVSNYQNPPPGENMIRSLHLLLCPF